MAYGQTGSGSALSLDYDSMCNNSCKCGGKLGYCLPWKKENYKNGVCKDACSAWFPGDETLAQACQSACDIPGNRPKSLLDYVERFPTDQQIISKYGYDFDPTTGTGTDLLNKMKSSGTLKTIGMGVLLLLFVGVLFFLLYKYV